MRETLRRFDRHRRQLLISELVDLPSRAFHLGFQLALAEFNSIVDAIVNRAGPLEDGARRLYRMTLANYFAAAAMMPYQEVHAAAETLGYDVHVIAQRFNASFEQVCHRLTTLQRPNARGVPFFPLRVGQRRQRLQAFFVRHLPVLEVRRHLSPLECALHLRHPGPPAAPDRGAARRQPLLLHRADAATTRRPHPHPQPRFAIGLGCEIRYAAKLVYADGDGPGQVEQARRSA